MAILLLNTLGLFAAVCVFAIPTGTFLGWLAVRTNTPGRHAFLWLMVAFVFMPLYLQAAAWEAGFGQQGWYQLPSDLGARALLSGWRGAVWVHSIAALPWIVLLVGAHLRARDSGCEAIALVDTSPWGVFWRLSLWETTPAMGSAALWIFAIVMSEISVTDLFQVRTLAEEVYVGFALSGDATQDVPRFVIIAVGAALAVGGGLWFLIRCASTLSKWEATYQESLSLGRLRWVASAVFVLAATLVAGVPLCNLIYKAGIEVSDMDGLRVRTWSVSKAIGLTYEALWGFRAEIGWSLLLSQCACLAALVIAVPLAWLSRGRRSVSVLAGALVTLSIAISGPILGVVVIGLFQLSKAPLLETIYSQTIAAPCIVLALRCFPLVMLVVWIGIRGVDRETLLTAELQGARPWAQLTYVVLPWKWPVLVVAWLLGIAACLGELSGSILTVPPGVTTVAIRAFGLLHYGVEDRLAALCLASSCLVGVVLMMTWLVLCWSVAEARIDQPSRS